MSEPSLYFPILLHNDELLQHSTRIPKINGTTSLIHPVTLTQKRRAGDELLLEKLFAGVRVTLHEVQVSTQLVPSVVWEYAAEASGGLGIYLRDRLVPFRFPFVD